MEHDRIASNRVKELRTRRGWSQDELARRAGISRAGVSAIEISRLVPSVVAALALAAALDCSVEELFGGSNSNAEDPVWAWPCNHDACRFWQAKVGARLLLYPVESTSLGMIEHDGVQQGASRRLCSRTASSETLVMASCDPAAGLLAAALERAAGIRLLVFMRSSRQALELLKQGLVHVAGLHLANADSPDGNSNAASAALDEDFSLLRLARWQEGVVLSPGLGIRTVRNALGADLRWVGREPGSAARQCLDELFGDRRPPRRLAASHQGVAEAVRSGWADAGVCLRLAGEEAGLPFLSVRDEAYDLCYASDSAADPRIEALVKVVRSASFRQLLGDLPGYDSSETGLEAKGAAVSSLSTAKIGHKSAENRGA